MLVLNPLHRNIAYRDGHPVMYGAFPALGHLPAIASDPIAFERKAERELGSMFWINPILNHFQLVCLAPEASAAFRDVTSAEHPLPTLKDFLGNAIIGKDGASHHRIRSAMANTFAPRGLTDSRAGELSAQVIERHIHKWLTQPVLRLLPSTRDLALTVAFRILDVPESTLPQWRLDYEQYEHYLASLPINLPGFSRRRAIMAKARLNARIRGLLDAIRVTPDATGLLASLLRGRDERGGMLTEDEMVDNFRFLVFASHENTASVVAWMVAMLASRPAMWDALCTEAVAANGPPRSPGDLKNFPFAEAFFREILRYYPPINRILRRALKDFTLAGRTIRRDTVVNVSILHLSRHPTLYERPDEFVPERWLNRNAPPSQLEQVQFGHGLHFCLGYHMARMEAIQFAVIFARLLHARGLRPVLDGGSLPAVRYLPLLHPDPKTTVRFTA
jgi:cytochrome P450 family 117 subfamily A